MSAAEIADNRWELESTRPPTRSLGAIAQIILMAAFGVFVLGIIGMAVMGTIQGPQKSQLERGLEKSNVPQR